jgi:vacuolar protein sorting-associated protein 13A/C
VKDSQALVLDAGHISVESNLVNKEQLKELQSKRGKQYDEDDFKQLEDLMYDKFSLQLEATQVSLLPLFTLQTEG